MAERACGPSARRELGCSAGLRRGKRGRWHGPERELLRSGPDARSGLGRERGEALGAGWVGKGAGLGLLSFVFSLVFFSFSSFSNKLKPKLNSNQI